MLVFTVGTVGRTDSVYGDDMTLRAWLETRPLAYVMGTT